MSDRVTTPPLGVPRLESFLARTLERRDTKPGGAVPTPEQWELDVTLLNGLGVQVRSALTYVFEQRPSLEALERWVLAKHEGGLEREHLDRLSAALEGRLAVDRPAPEDAVLDAAALASFAEHGLVRIPAVASAAECDAARSALWQHLGGPPDQPGCWPSSPVGHAVEVALVHHPALDAIRRSPRARHAFAQLWDRTDLWPVIEPLVVTRPEASPSARLRWEIDPTPPVPFGVRALVYLEDTPTDAGAFVTVPGFHRQIDAWLRSLPPHALPHDQDLTSLGMAAMPGEKGDMVLWHHALPYGRAPHTGTTPTAAQYLCFRPTRT